MGGWLQFGRGEVGCGRRRGRRRRNRGRESVGKSAVDFAGGSDMSLLGCPGLNPSVYSVGKFV
jgi:hypothetical protein